MSRLLLLARGVLAAAPRRQAAAAVNRTAADLNCCRFFSSQPQAPQPSNPDAPGDGVRKLSGKVTVRATTGYSWLDSLAGLKNTEALLIAQSQCLFSHCAEPAKVEQFFEVRDGRDAREWNGVG
jgi:hypothetical protein